MTKNQAARQGDSSMEELNDIIIKSIQDIKGIDIIKLDLRELDDAPTDFFIICEGTSNTQVQAIGNSIAKNVKDELRMLPSHMEGMKNGQWVIVDYFNIVVHIFYPKARKFYDLETLWSDAVITEYQNL